MIKSTVHDVADGFRGRLPVSVSLLRFVAPTVLALAGALPHVFADWPVAGGDARNTNVSHHAGVRHGTLAWTLDDEPFTVYSWPSVAVNRTIFATGYQRTGDTHDYLRALDPEGSLLWKVPIRALDGAYLGVSSTNPPTIGPDGRVYVGFASRGLSGTDQLALQAFDGATGERLWSYEPNFTDQQPRGPAKLSDDGATLFIPMDKYGGGGWVLAVDAQTGELVWSFELLLAETAAPSVTVGPGNRVYLLTENYPGSEGSLYALDGANGAIIWHIHRSNFGTGIPATVDDEGSIYCFGDPFPNRINKFDSNGDKLWYHQVPFNPPRGALAVKGGKVYVSIAKSHPAYARGVRILDAGTGELLQILDPDRYSSAVALDHSGRIYADTNDWFTCFSPSGLRIWEYTDYGSAVGLVLGHDELILQHMPGSPVRLKAYGPSGQGDMNCDGTINGFDIEPFVVAITDPDAFAHRWPDCEVARADVNADGSSNAGDIEVFKEVLKR